MKMTFGLVRMRMGKHSLLFSSRISSKDDSIEIHDGS